MGLIAGLLFLGIWSIQALLQVFVWIYWWQVKEYRFDRFKVLLKSKSGINKLYFKLIVFKIIAILISPSYQIPLILYIVIDCYLVSQLYKKRVPKPVFTQRAQKLLLITFAGVGIVFALAALNIYNFAQSLLVAELLLILGPLAGILWTRPTVEKVKRSEIAKAEKRLMQINPRVIGITGSYGKSTTKEFLSHLLSKKYKVEKTTANQNNEFGVARKILSDFSNDAEVFVAEMGAYTKGEIEALAAFTHPDIGFITGLEPQHLELFGTYENVKKAKFELIKALPEKATAVFNVSNPDCEEMAKNAQKLPTKLSVLRYKVVKKFPKSKHIDAASVVTKQSSQGIEFTVRMDGKKTALTTPLTSIHFVENLTGSILIARKLGVSWSQIKKLCKSVIPPKNTMDTATLASGALLIDDTYNSTPKGFLAALDFLKSTKYDKKVIVTSGIIELGAYSHIVHKDLGGVVAAFADLLVVTNPDFASDLYDGLGSHGDKLAIEPDGEKLVTLFKRINKKDTAILLEGRLPSRLIEYIETQK